MPKVPSKPTGRPKRPVVETDRARQSREQQSVKVGRGKRKDLSRDTDVDELVEPLTGCLPQGVLAESVTGCLPHCALPEGVASSSSATMTGCLPQGDAAGADNSDQPTLALILQELRQLRKSVDKNQGDIQQLKGSTNQPKDVTPERSTDQTSDVPRDEHDNNEGEQEVIVSLGMDMTDVDVAADRPVILGGTPLDSVVPDKVKHDIWANKFIGLALLLQPHQEESTHYDMVFIPEKGFKMDNKTKKIISIIEWEKAFDIFIAIVTQRDQSAGVVSDLLTYKHEIKSLASDGYHWALYDQQYRLQSASSDQPARWSALNQQLHNKVMRKGKITFNSTFRTHSANAGKHTYSDYTPIPKGFCFAFHSSGKRCTSYPCTYRHTCYRCMSRHPHPAHKCGIHTDSPRTQASRQPSNKSSWGFKRTQGGDGNAFSYQRR